MRTSAAFKYTGYSSNMGLENDADLKRLKGGAAEGEGEGGEVGKRGEEGGFLS